MEAAKEQVGGNHYAKLEYQPFEFAMDVGGTPAMCKVAKYLTRDKDDRLVNLRKAYHVIDLEADYLKTENGIMFYGGAKAREPSVWEKKCIERFCAQFINGFAYRPILTCLLVDKHSKAKENLTKLVKYMRWELI